MTRDRAPTARAAPHALSDRARGPGARLRGLAPRTRSPWPSVALPASAAWLASIAIGGIGAIAGNGCITGIGGTRMGPIAIGSPNGRPTGIGAMRAGIAGAGAATGMGCAQRRGGRRRLRPRQRQGVERFAPLAPRPAMPPPARCRTESRMSSSCQRSSAGLERRAGCRSRFADGFLSLPDIGRYNSYFEQQAARFDAVPHFAQLLG